MTLALTLAGAVIVIFCVLVFALWRPIDPYDASNQPGTAPPRGTWGRRMWRRLAHRGPRPGSPL